MEIPTARLLKNALKDFITKSHKNGIYTYKTGEDSPYTLKYTKIRGELDRADLFITKKGKTEVLAEGSIAVMDYLVEHYDI